MCSELEKSHPHVIHKLKIYWTSDVFNPYINSLILSDRDRRNGFSKEVISELMVIQRVHNQLFGSHNEIL